MADGTIKILTDLSPDGFKQGLSKLTGIAKTGLSAVTTSITAAGTALIGLGGYAVKVGSSFEAGMSEVAAISGATGKDLEALTAKAKEMGASTKFSATESAEALKYMAMAGWDTDKMLSGLPGIMNLAAASGENLGTVSDIVTDAMTAFGLSADQAGHFADVLAQASSKSNTNVGLMGETFKYVAPVAGTLGYSIEDTAVAIGLMANAGIKGGQSGTALRSMLTRLAKPTDEVQGAMEDLGISLTDSEGNMKSFKEVVGDMRKGFQGLSKDQQAQYAATLAGQEGMSGLLAIVTASEEDFNALTEAINSSDGAAQQMADTMQDNLQGSVTIAKSALEGLGITVYEQIEAPLRSVVESGTEYINRLNEAFSHGLDSGVKALGDIFADISVKAAESAPRMLESGTQLILSFLDGIEKNSKNIAQSAVKIGQALVKAFTQLVPQIGKIGLSIIKEFAKQLFGYNIGKQIGDLGKTVEAAFKKISDAVTKGFGKIQPAVEKIGKAFLSVADTGIKILSDAIAFLCENCNILIPALAAVAGAITAWSIVESVTASMKKSSEVIDKFTTAVTKEGIAHAAATVSITAKQVAVGVLTGHISLVTAAQWAWNAAVTALGGPIGVVITVIAAFAAGIAALCLMQENEITAEEKLSEANEKLGDVYTDVIGKADSYAKKVQEANGIMDALNSTMGVTAQQQQEVADQMASVQEQINAIAKTASDERRGYTHEEIATLQDLFAQMNALAEQQLQLQQSYQDAVATQAEALAKTENITAEEYAEWSANISKSAQETANDVIAAAEDKYTQTVALADQERDAVLNSAEEQSAESIRLAEETYQNAIDMAQEDYQNEVDTANAKCADTNAILANGYAARATTAKEWINTLKDYNNQEIEAKNANNAAVKKAWDDYNAIADKGSNEAIAAKKIAQTLECELESKNSKDIADIREKKANHLKSISSDELAVLVGMVAQSADTYGDLNAETRSMVDEFLLNVDKLPPETRDSMNETLKGMNLEIQEGGKIMHKNADGTMTEFVATVSSYKDDSEAATQDIVDGMSDITGGTVLPGPTMGEIAGVGTAAYNAIAALKRIVGGASIGANIAVSVTGGYHAKGGVTGYAKGGVSAQNPKISKHAAGVFTKRTRLWDPVTGVNEYGEAGHEALLPLKESVFNEIAKGISRQLTPAKLSGLMEQMRSAVQAEMSNISIQMIASPTFAQTEKSSKTEKAVGRLEEKMNSIIEKLDNFANLTVTMNGEKVGRLVTDTVNAGLGEIYATDERVKF